MTVGAVATLSVLELPLRIPFATATGTVGERRVVLVRTGDGPHGWGEAAPFPGQDESLDELLTAAREGAATPTLRAALDEAEADRTARLASRPLSAPSRDRVPISVAVGIDDALGRVDRLVAAGVTRFKVKVAPDRYEHLERLRSAHGGIALGVDGNRSFDSLDGIAGALVRVGVVYAEELLAPGASADIEFLTAAGIPHFADESLRSVGDAERLVRSGRYTGLTVKPGRLGWTGARLVVDTARREGIPWRASGLLETGIGRAFTDRLAAEADAFVSDVAPADWFLTRDISARRHQGGDVLIPHGPGIGVEPDVDALAAYTVERIEVEVPAGM